MENNGLHTVTEKKSIHLSSHCGDLACLKWVQFSIVLFFYPYFNIYKNNSVWSVRLLLNTYRGRHREGEARVKSIILFSETKGYPITAQVSGKA
jgi:hypothetical protein